MVRAKRIALVAALILAIPTSASAIMLKFGATLDGAGGTPPNPSTASGSVRIAFNTGTHMMRIVSSFDGFPSPTTASHIHCCTTAPFVRDSLIANPPIAAGQNQWPTFPLGVTSGHFDATFDMSLASSWRGGFITANGGTPLAAEAVLVNGMLDGRAIFNIHTVDFPDGEIGAFLEVLAVPEPASIGIFGLGLAILAMRRRAGRPTESPRTQIAA